MLRTCLVVASRAAECRDRGIPQAQQGYAAKARNVRHEANYDDRPDRRKNEKGRPLATPPVAGFWAAAPAMQARTRCLRGARPPQAVRGEHAMGDPEARLMVITAALGVAGVARPGSFAWGAVGKFEGPARNVWAPWPVPRRRGHGGELGLPPRPHFAFGTIPFGTVREGASDTDESSRTVAKIPSRPGPTICALHDELMPTKTTQNGGCMSGRNAEDPRS